MFTQNNMESERIINYLLENCPEFRNAFEIPNEWIFTMKINGPTLKIEDLHSTFYKRFKIDPNYETNDFEEYFKSMNRLLDNFEIIKDKYTRLFAPMYKKSIIIFQMQKYYGYIYLIDGKLELHYNFFNNNLNCIDDIYINEIYKVEKENV
jgi:hypothetical protein